MARINAEALILATRNWGTADKMVTLFTREQGIVQAVAFGCRRPKSPLAAGMQMFSYLDVEFTEGTRVWTVRQCTLKEHWHRLGEDLASMAYGSFIAELTLALIPEHEPEPDTFDRLLQVFRAFEERNPRLVALAAAYQLLVLSGLGLHLESCVHCGKESEDLIGIDINEGGVLCRNCCTEEARPLSPALHDLLKKFLLLEWKRVVPITKEPEWGNCRTEAANDKTSEAAPKISIKKAELLQAEELLLTYLHSLLGRPLRSLAFIAQLAKI